MTEERPDRHNFAGLYRATITPLRRYLARMLGSTTEAQDVAHDAYVRVYPKVQDASARNPEAVLYTTARRLALNKIKRRTVAPFAASEPHLESTPSPDPGVVQQVMARQELQHLEVALAQLPPGCRTVLLLRKIELLSHTEIAERLGISISTVEKQHARALRLLRVALPSNLNVTQTNLPPTREVRS
jgi:RNA polymerase sigma-70 factor (ECF subfamily)